MTGDVQSIFSSPSTTRQIVRDGKVRLLAVSGPTRDPNTPEAPTLVESGLRGFESNTWFALMASSKTPADVLEKIRTDVGHAMKNPVVIKQIKDINRVRSGTPPRNFVEMIK